MDTILIKILSHESCAEMSDKQLVNTSRKQFMWTGGEGLTPGCMKGLGGGLMKL